MTTGALFNMHANNCGMPNTKQYALHLNKPTRKKKFNDLLTISKKCIVGQKMKQINKNYKSINPKKETYWNQKR